MRAALSLVDLVSKALALRMECLIRHGDAQGSASKLAECMHFKHYSNELTADAQHGQTSTAGSAQGTKDLRSGKVQNHDEQIVNKQFATATAMMTTTLGIVPLHEAYLPIPGDSWSSHDGSSAAPVGANLDHTETQGGRLQLNVMQCDLNKQQAHLSCIWQYSVYKV